MEMKFMAIEELLAQRTGSNKRKHTAQLAGRRPGWQCGHKQQIARVQPSQ